MGNFTEFSFGPEGVSLTARSFWPLRDEGLEKVLKGAWGFIEETGRMRRIKERVSVRIHTHDFPTKESPKTKGLVELQTISEMGRGDRLFPDWVFGGWRHIGMRDWDEFVSELARAGRAPPKDKRAFWKGAHLHVNQRERYMNLCESRPDMFAGGFMRWGHDGDSEGFTPMSEQCEHAVLVDLTGVGFSGRLKMLGFAGRPLIVAKRRWLSWADQEILSLGLHHECNEDLSDLPEVYERLVSNMEESVEKALKLKDFCASRLTFDSVRFHAARVLMRALANSSMMI